jgi:hypothetical protein
MSATVPATTTIYCPECGATTRRLGVVTEQDWSTAERSAGSARGDAHCPACGYGHAEATIRWGTTQAAEHLRVVK